MKTTWSVLAVYEDEETRGAALRFCDLLVEKFWTSCSFDVNWCSGDLLREEQTATAAARKASEADVIVFAVQPNGAPVTLVKQWNDLWVRLRQEREGLLIGLVTNSTQPSADRLGTECYLRRLAHGAGMDFVTELPEEISGPLPDLESCTDRARNVTSTLAAILHQHDNPRPPIP